MATQNSNKSKFKNLHCNAYHQSYKGDSYKWEAQWPHGLRSERSRFEPWPGTLCCVLGQDTTLMVPLSTQVYKWVPAKLMLGVTLQCTSIPSRGEVEVLPVTSCYRNWDKLRPDGALAPIQTLPLPFTSHTNV